MEEKQPVCQITIFTENGEQVVKFYDWFDARDWIDTQRCLAGEFWRRGYNFKLIGSTKFWIKGPE